MKQLIEVLNRSRNKLIDLSNRNKLIKFNLDPRRPRHINIVHSSLEEVWKLIGSGEPLKIRFFSELEEHASTDPSKQTLSFEQLATKYEINLSLQLPIKVVESIEGGNNDLQTLLPFDQFRRLISRLSDNARIANEEKGVNTLYCALGFLQWQESKTSDLFMTSPLLLAPVELERITDHVTSGGTSLTGGGSEYESWMVNPSLKLKLKNDFDLELPQWQLDDTPASFFKRVEAAIAVYPRWSVLPRVLISNFTFPKLALYEDLDLQNWETEDGNLLIKHPVIQQLLLGVERESSSEERNLDEDDFVAASVEGVVFSADSSQLKSIQRVIEGESLVLEGPPGTGKSQTIANLICVAMAQGKKVLFIADKKAAIEVVQQRLEKVGLDSFCLNLHDSSKSAKQVFYDSLKKRLDLTKEKGVTGNNYSSFCEQRERISNTAKRLNEYYAQLAHSTGESGSVANVLWSSLKTRELFVKLPASISGKEIPDALSISSGHQSEIHRYLKDLEEAMRSLGLSEGGLRQHNLCGIGWTEINFYKENKLGEVIDALHTLVVSLIGHSSELHRLGLLITDVSVIKCENLSDLCSVMDKRTDYSLLQALIGQLEDSSWGECVYSFVRLCPQLSSITLDAETIAELLSISRRLITYTTGSHSSGISLDCLSERLFEAKESVDRFIRSLRIIDEFTQETLPKVVSKASVNWSELLSDLAELLRHLVDEDASVFRYLTSALHEGVSDNHWANLWDSTKRSQELHEELQAVCSPEGLLHSDVVDSLCSKLCSSNLTRCLHPKWWQARAKLATLFNKTLKQSDRLALLSKLQMWHKLDIFVRKDARLIDLIGEVSHVGTIDFEAILRAQDIHSKIYSSNPEIWSEVQKNNVSGQTLWAKASELLGDRSIEILFETAREIDNRFNGGTLEQIGDLAMEHFEEILQLIKDLEKLGTGQEVARERMTEVQTSLEKLQSFCGVSYPFARYSAKEVFIALELLDNIAESVPAEIIYSFLSIMNVSNEKEIACIFEQLKNLIPLVKKFYQRFDTFQELGEIHENSPLGRKAQSTTPLDVIQERFACVKRSLHDLHHWVELQRILGVLEERMHPAWVLVKQCMDEDRSFIGIEKIFETMLSQSRAMEVLHLSQHALGGGANEIQRVQDRFVKEELQYQKISLKYVEEALLARCVPPGSRSSSRRGEWTGVELIKHELGKKNRRVSQRNLIGRAAASLQELTPCFMMSPLTVAQYLSPKSKIMFDLVLIDEASQMRPEEAFSAIARGNQLVVVGDSKQLPPSNFFCGVSDDEDVADEDAIDNESILDMASVIFSSQSLLWHYRSRHDSLIYFSNRHFYDDRLIICPSPRAVSELAGVHLVQVNGLYTAKKPNLNHMEADAVVAKAVELMRGYPEMSIGIVAINSSQQEHINSLLYEMRCNDSQVDEYLKSWEQRSERCFVKNLENIQGDERDIILISTVYGPQEPDGKVLRRFGPINSKTGHRRLNVLCTRARDCMYVFTSLKPTDICPLNVSDISVGLQAFAKFLEFAGSGIQSTSGEQSNSSSGSGDPDSPFEEYVGDLLTREGYSIDYQVGQSGFRIDIGVRCSTFPYGYIAGVECDGALYHSHKTARDRDRLRQDLLEDHGWNIYRVWSTDWFNDPKNEGKKLLNWLEERTNQLVDNSKTKIGKKSDLVLGINDANPT